MWICAIAIALLCGSVSADAVLHLLPTPQRTEAGKGSFALSGGCTVWISTDAAPNTVAAAEEYAQRLTDKAGVSAWVSQDVALSPLAVVITGPNTKIPTPPTLTPPDRAESYALLVAATSVAIVGKDEAGLFYGVQTLLQLTEGRGAKARIASTRITDWPDYPMRGVHVMWDNSMHDTCQDPEFTTLDRRYQVYTADEFIDQIRTLARFKVNTVFWEVGRGIEFRLQADLNSPHRLSQEDVRRVVEEARKVYVTLIPIYNSFGHVQRIVDHPTYTQLQEDLPSTRGYQFCPSEPGVLKLLDSVYTELCDLIPGEYVHIGCDETKTFGDARCLARAKERGWIDDKGEISETGRGIMYAEYVAACAEMLHKHGRRAIIWADKMTPEIAAAMPKDVVLMHWYYAEDPKSARIKGITEYSQYEAMVAPSAMANGSGSAFLVPLTETHRRNIKLMCKVGKGKAKAVCVTTWPTFPGPPQVAFWNGYLYAADRMWRPDSPLDGSAWQLAFSRNCYGFESESIGKAWDIVGSATQGKKLEWRRLLFFGGDPRFYSPSQGVESDTPLFTPGEGTGYLSEKRATEIDVEMKQAIALIDQYVTDAKAAGVDLSHEKSIAFVRHNARIYLHIAHTRLWAANLQSMTETDRSDKQAELRREAEDLIAETPKIWAHGPRRDHDWVVECWQTIHRRAGIARP